ncbi:ArsR/SmtB family transcription factor [Kordiimonas sediminis]|nr:metalloregulator ArsR/SmtB family transcription factor [Kordiimonas sediminis]
MKNSLVKETSFENMSANADRAASMMKLLSNPSRLMILCHLNEGEQTVGALVETVDLSQSAVSQHLAKLREQGIVQSHREGQNIYYKISSTEVHAIIKMLYSLYCR